MDSVLKELKEIREETEESLTVIIEKLESASGKISSELEGLHQDRDKAAANLDAATFINLLGYLHDSNRQMQQAIRKTISLNNARSAELARQLTVLPLERMDIVLDRFEARLEGLEAEVNRLKK